jgi:cytochrome c
MDSMEVNKAFAAVLTAGIVFMVAGVVGQQIVRPEMPHHAAIQIGAPAAPTTAAPAAPTLEPVSPLLAAANPQNGQLLAQRNCAACHSLNEGGRSGVGPNLYGIMGAPHAHIEGFNYSAALRAKQGPWTYEEMNAWLARPSTYAPGTRMAYAGMPSVQQRADLIAYLRSLAGTPIPLPEAVAPAAAAPAAAPAAAAPAAAAPAAAAPAAPSPAAAPAIAGLDPIGPLLATADIAAGEQLARQQCGICHTFTEGGRNGVGPNLWNVVGGPHAHAEGFNYSPALRGKDGPWTYEELNAWLYRPMQYAPGTRMAYAGMNNPQNRANVIAYLRSLSANPQPLP